MHAVEEEPHSGQAARGRAEAAAPGQGAAAGRAGDAWPRPRTLRQTLGCDAHRRVADEMARYRVMMQAAAAAGGRLRWPWWRRPAAPRPRNWSAAWPSCAAWGSSRCTPTPSSPRDLVLGGLARWRAPATSWRRGTTRRWRRWSRCGAATAALSCCRTSTPAALGAVAEAVHRLQRHHRPAHLADLHLRHSRAARPDAGTAASAAEPKATTSASFMALARGRDRHGAARAKPAS